MYEGRRMGVLVDPILGLECILVLQWMVGGGLFNMMGQG